MKVPKVRRIVVSKFKGSPAPSAGCFLTVAQGIAKCTEECYNKFLKKVLPVVNKRVESVREASPNDAERAKLQQDLWSADPEVALKEVSSYFAPETDDKEAGTGAVNLSVIAKQVQAVRARQEQRYTSRADQVNAMNPSELASFAQTGWQNEVRHRADMEHFKPTSEYKEARLDLSLGNAALTIVELRDPSIAESDEYAELTATLQDLAAPMDAITNSVTAPRVGTL